jgi:4-amino-4-deoxy-L-arabinose transferase-like glycosyltransferase
MRAPAAGATTAAAEPLEAAPAPPVRHPMLNWRDPRVAALIVVFCVGALHAFSYAVAFPPWHIEDEAQHVDYVAKLGRDFRLPSLDDRLDRSILRSTQEDRDWKAYGLAVPDRPADDTGLGTNSYEAYHPPVPYLLGVPVVMVTKDEALLSLYGLRMVTVLAAGAVCVLAAHLAARRFHGGQAVRAALGAGLAVALLPAIADSGGRFNTDIFAALAVLVVVLALLRWVEHPTAGRAWQVGAALALAALTRETTLVVVVPLVVAGVALARRRELRLGDLARALVPPALAITAWELHLQVSTGRYNGAGAFVDQYGRQFPTLGFGDVISGLLSRGYLPYGHWGLPAAITLLVFVMLVAGLVLADRVGRRVEAVTAAAMLVLQLLVMVASSSTGLNTASARLLLPSYPVVIAMATAGWASIRPRAATYLPALATLLMASWFMVAELWPTYR